MLGKRVVTLLTSISILLSIAGRAAADTTGLIYTLRDVPGGSNSIYGFRLDSASGSLTPLAGFPLATGGTGSGHYGSERIVYFGGRLYVINDGTDTLSVYSVNQATGALTPMPFSPISLGAGTWHCVAVHPFGSPVVVGNGPDPGPGVTGSIASFNITAGSATPAFGSPYTTGAALPFSCAFSTDGAYVYTGGNGGWHMAGFGVAQASGFLTPLSGSPWDVNSSFPLGYATDRAGRIFAASFRGMQVSAFTTSNGVPANASGSPFASGLAVDTPTHAVLHPAGFYIVATRCPAVYVVQPGQYEPPCWTNPGDENRVGVFRIGGSGSSTILSPVSGSPFATGGILTDALALNRDGDLLVAANGESRNLTVFRFNPGTGNLTSLGVQAADTMGTTGFLSGLAFAPSVPPADGGFTQNGKKSLIWHHSQRGAVAAWFMDGFTTTGSAYITEGSGDIWRVAGAADFSADGKTDLLWQNRNTGELAAWLLDGITLQSATAVASGSSLDWKVVGTGDFNGDGHADLLWQHNLNSGLVAWLMNGTALVEAKWVDQGSDPLWRVVAIADFDADGWPDLLWQHQTTGSLIVWHMNGTALRTPQWVTPNEVSDTAWRVAAAADMNNDGWADLVWQHTNGRTIAWLMNGTTMTGAAWIVQQHEVSDTAWRLVAIR